MDPSKSSVAEKIWQAVLQIADGDHERTFRRVDVANIIERFPFDIGPVFQGMREDEPGHAPKPQKKLQGVFRRLRRGLYALSEYGTQLMRATSLPAEISAQELRAESEAIEAIGYFDGESLLDERERITREIVQRRGQAEFRAKLLDAYDSKCCVSGCDASDALEAAHIFPYKGPASNRIENGLLFRADIHTLFDLGLFAIEPETLVIRLDGKLKSSSYGQLEGVKMTIPKSDADRPNSGALRARWYRFMPTVDES